MRARRRAQSSVSGRGMSVGGRVRRSRGPNGVVPVKDESGDRRRGERTGPRMYCKGSPHSLRSSMSNNLFGCFCFIHFSSLCADSRPMSSASFASRFFMRVVLLKINSDYIILKLDSWRSPPPRTANEYMYDPCPPTSLTPRPRCPPPTSTPLTCLTKIITLYTNENPHHHQSEGALLRQTRAATHLHTHLENTETAQRRKRPTALAPTAKRLISLATIVRLRAFSPDIVLSHPPSSHSPSLPTLHKTRHGWKLRRGSSQKSKVSPRR